MFQIARRHLVWFTGLTCDELSAANQSAFKVQNRQTKEKKKKRSPFYDSAPSARVITDPHEWINGDSTRCDIYLILPSSISVAEVMLIVIYAKCLRNVPFHLILNHVYGLIFNQAAM